MDVELNRELLVLVNIDLTHLGFAVVFIGQLVDHRADHFAGAAPFSPKIDEDGSSGLDDLSVEILRS